MKRHLLGSHFIAIATASALSAILPACTEDTETEPATSTSSEALRNVNACDSVFKACEALVTAPSDLVACGTALQSCLLNNVTDAGSAVSVNPPATVIPPVVWVDAGSTISVIPPIVLVDAGSISVVSPPISVGKGSTVTSIIDAAIAPTPVSPPNVGSSILAPQIACVAPLRTCLTSTPLMLTSCIDAARTCLTAAVQTECASLRASCADAGIVNAVCDAEHLLCR